MRERDKVHVGSKVRISQGKYHSETGKVLEIDQTAEGTTVLIKTNVGLRFVDIPPSMTPDEFLPKVQKEKVTA